MKKIKELFKGYNDWKEQPEIKKRRMIAFFSFYLVFFSVLIFFIRTAKNENKVPPVTEDDIYYKTDLIENNNYEYFYYIEEDDQNYTFQGVRDDENSELSEYKYKELVNIYTIKRIIKNSKYLLKVENGNDLISYKYEITNNELAKILEYKEEIENDINPIIVYVDKDKNVYQIEFDYSNYMKAIGEFETYKLTIKYGARDNEKSSTD